MLVPPYNIHSMNMPIHQTAWKTQSKVDHSLLRWHIVSCLVVTVDPTPKPSCYSSYGSGSCEILRIFQSKQVLLRVNFAMGTWVNEHIRGLSLVMVLNPLIYCSICSHYWGIHCAWGEMGDAVWRQGTPRNLGQGHFLCLSPLMSILNINRGTDREHSLPLGLVSLRWKQFKSDVEVLGENNGILLIWWDFVESFGL